MNFDCTFFNILCLGGGELIRNFVNFYSHFALGLLEELPEVGRGGGEDHLVRVVGAAPAAGQSDVTETVVAEHLPRKFAQSVAVVAPVQPHRGRGGVILHLVDSFGISIIKISHDSVQRSNALLCFLF